ncbi:SH3 domain-containing protein [Salipiger bermudensis]|uniref:SH3 domain-containing protein n=1 Tax=Salipiger bermudensis TaxID=344736 RepID=UPI001C99F7C2|nr:SH3 domain-containing protein [Salipiger bermudensis]MBY6002883.1 SH3 domain-containing protein [Salipiger bermudensis]
MTRFVFIVMTFGFLSLAWYEMSGGAEFEPGTQTVNLPTIDFASAESDEMLAAEAARAETVDLTTVAPAAATQAKADRPAVDKLGVTLASAAAVPQPAVEPEKAVEVAALDTRSDATVEGATVERVVFGAEPEPVLAPELDLRRVTGNVVNMRNGPSTGFPVVSQLRRGDEVEVLADPGEGWVKLQVLETNRVGWMSARFLRAAN